LADGWCDVAVLLIARPASATSPQTDRDLAIDIDIDRFEPFNQISVKTRPS
jgi:hypothetical protein